MKKIFTSLAVLALCSTAAFAQDENPFMSFSPANNAELTSLQTTVTITASDLGLELAPDAANVMIQAVAGYGFSQDVKEPVYYPMENGVATFTLQEDMWGVPFNKVYYLQLIVALADEDEVPIYSDEMDDYIMGMCAYTCPDNGPAAWVKNYPNERNWEEEGLTFSRFYNIGECIFYFTKEVTLPDVPGYIVYTEKNGATDEPDIENFSYGWDEELGLYAVTVNVKNDTYTAESLQSIEVILEGVENAEGQEIDVPSILATNSASPKTAPRKVKKLENGLTAGNESVNIYNVQGMLVKENVSVNAVNELPAGLYIINGKKIVIR